jgi:DNA-3-methyladenine glycosylase
MEQEKEIQSDPKITERGFFRVNCIELSKKLIGTKLVRVINGRRIVGVIIETEAYLGNEDKAAHSYQNKKTEKNEAMYLDAGK